jgi:hypothetical protein
MLLILANPAVRARAMRLVSEAPDGWVVDIREPKRNEDQSALFHARCTLLEQSNIEWAGKRRSKDEWKILLVSGHAVATKIGAEMVPGLEGEFCNLRERTATMGRKRMTSLIEYTTAFCVDKGIQIPAGEGYDDTFRG